MIGLVVDGLEILRPLGVGGMGEVFLARADDGSLRALKVVRTDGGIGAQAGAQALARLRREVTLLGKLRHPAIVQILDAGRIEGDGLYLAMEYVPGPDLQSAIGSDVPLPLGDALDLLARLAAALAHAHELGIVHRDLKPANVLLEDGEPGRAKIIDFGLAKVVADEQLTRLTADGDILGSPMYWAPEQSTTAAVGPAADVYALGGLAYFALTGEPMFRARPAVALVYAHVHEPAPSLAARCPDVELPPELVELVHACVAKQPAERPSAEQLARELHRLRAAAQHGSRTTRARTRGTPRRLAEALEAQIRQIVVELGAVLGRSTEALDRAQHQLAELEIDLAMLDSELDTRWTPELARDRAALAARVAELQGAIANAYRELQAAVLADRARAPADASSLYGELDGLVAQYRSL